MTAASDHPIFQFALWRAISVSKTNAGYAVFEAPDRFGKERLAEAVLRLTGVGLILIGYLQWFQPDALVRANPMTEKLLLSVLFMGTGIALYFFASRGFRKDVHLKVQNRQISIGRLNARDRCLISRQNPMDRIESLVIGRATSETPLASLHMRLKGFPRSFCVMRGAQSEIEDLHRQLCRDIQLALSVPRAKPVRPTRIRPTMHKKADQARPVSAFRSEQSRKPTMVFAGSGAGR